LFYREYTKSKIFPEKHLHLSDPIFNLNNGYFEQHVTRNSLVFPKQFWFSTEYPDMFLNSPGTKQRLYLL